MRVAPRCEHGERVGIAPFARVQEVAEEDKARRREPRDQRIEPAERTDRRPPRHAHAERTERRRLAEVRVRHEEHPSLVPVHRALRAQHQLLAGDARRDVSRVAPRVAHPAARSSASCIRAIRSASFSLDTLFRVRSTSNGNDSGVNRFGVVSTTRAVANRWSVAPSRLRSS